VNTQSVRNTSKLQITLLGLFVASLLFSLLTYFSHTGGEVGRRWPTIVLPLLGMLYIYFREKIKVPWLVLILAIPLSLILLLINTLVCMGYCSPSDTPVVLFGSVATFFFFSIFVVGSLKGIIRLLFLAIGGLLINFIMFTNSGFDIGSGQEQVFFIVSILFLLSILSIAIRKSKSFPK